MTILSGAFIFLVMMTPNRTKKITVAPSQGDGYLSNIPIKNQNNINAPCEQTRFSTSLSHLCSLWQILEWGPSVSHVSPSNWCAVICKMALIFSRDLKSGQRKCQTVYPWIGGTGDTSGGGMLVSWGGYAKISVWVCLCWPAKGLSVRADVRGEKGIYKWIHACVLRPYVRL